MKKFFKYAAVFVAGSLVGGLATYCVTKTKIEKEKEEEISSVVETFKNKEQLYLDHFETMHKLDDLSDKVDETLNKDSTEDNPHNIFVRNSELKEKMYSDLFKKNQKPEGTNEDISNKDEEEEDDRMIINSPDVENEYPYNITAEEFGEYVDYDVNTLYYFQCQNGEDYVVLDEADNIIQDPVSMIGDDFMDHYDEDENDPDVVYIRNDKLRQDYEVLRSESTYEEYMENNPLAEE